MAKTRQEVPLNDCWDVSALYATFELWQQDYQRFQIQKEELSFQQLIAYKGTLGKSPSHLKEFLDIYFTTDRALAKLYTYAHLRHDEDVSLDQYKQAYTRAAHLLADYREKTSWIEPELLHLSNESMQKLLESKELKDFSIYLAKILRLKPHILTEDQEQLLAQSAIALGTASKSFSAFNNGDIKFPSIVDSQGTLYELTHGTYQLYLRNEDRTLREAAFKTLHKSFENYENTLCELLQGQLQAHFFEQRARKYTSCLESALFPHQIDISVYKNLIKNVRDKLPSLHRYITLRKKILGHGDLYPWDLFVPLVKAADLSMNFDTAVDHVIESVSILGVDYQQELAKGLTTHRWVDRYENVYKRAGAYSSGCYDSMPYILMNFQGTFSDLRTLAHEAGHSMHSLLSHKNQPYQYAHYPIFIAEVASTFNEELLTRHLLEKTKSKEEKLFLINQKIDDIRATFFRQTMFAEFELKLHEWVESGIPLTPTLLKTEYHQLNRDYYGPDITLGEEIDIEWARIPHFYYHFYVYQYATGISAAFALIERLYKEGKKARDDYLYFLSAGSSQFPLDLLTTAGVDMHTPDATQATIRHFDELVTQLSAGL